MSKELCFSHCMSALGSRIGHGVFLSVTHDTLSALQQDFFGRDEIQGWKGLGKGSQK